MIETNSSLSKLGREVGIIRLTHTQERRVIRIREVGHGPRPLDLCQGYHFGGYSHVLHSHILTLSRFDGNPDRGSGRHFI